MIRIDEIYNNTLWPWIEKNIIQTRLFFCDPYGSTHPDTLYNYGKDEPELHYIFMHDQEPVLLDVQKPLFDAVVERNLDLNHGRDYYDYKSIRTQAMVTSERDSDAVDTVARLYNWRSYYYFFHGWASLDWFRGYDRTFLISEPGTRQIIHSIFSPNRIIGGRRDQRVLMIYHMIKQGIKNGLVSCPLICPDEKVSIDEIAERYKTVYPDIVDVLSSAGLPWNFPGETDHPMHSCWLSLFDVSEQCLVYFVTETLFFGRRNYLTEKSFKPICLKMPFVLVAPAGSLAYLRSYGFKTFNDFWDESYDQEIDDIKRMEKIGQLAKWFDDLDQEQLQDLHMKIQPIVEHNFQHFYKGDFEKILWQELTNMMEKIRNDFDF